MYQLKVYLVYLYKMSDQHVLLLTVFHKKEGETNCVNKCKLTTKINKNSLNK